MPRSVCVVLFPLLLAAQAGAASLFVDVSGSGTACTQASPCLLATALAQLATGDSVYVAGGTYTGTGSQVVLLDRGLTYTLQGGWDGAGGGPVAVDPDANETILDGQNARRVITITTGYPTIRGFTIRRGNASGLTVPCVNFIGNAAGCGGGVFAINSVPTIEDNVIEDNVASVAPPVPKVGVGGGIMVLTNWPTIRGNLIRRNVAATGGAGSGGGIALRHCVGTSLVQDNEISDNTASDAGIGLGGGVLIEYGTVAVTDNLFEGNVSTPAATAASGAGLYVSRGYCAARRNHFVGNRGDDTVYSLYFSGAVFEANRVVGNHTPIAVRFSTPETTEAASIANNFISDGGTVNLLLEGSTPNPIVATAVHNTIVGDDANDGIKAQGTVDATLRNNIVAGHDTGIDPPESGALTVDGTLFWKNDDDGVRGAGAVDGNPNFVDPLLRDFHIRVGSSAVDTAAAPAAAVTADIDGQSRPAGAAQRDIGADELPPTRIDFGTASSPVAAGYTRATEADRLQWYTGWGWASGTEASRSRGAGTALTRDFNLTRSGVFSLALPPGVYDVTATFGDASYAHDQMQVSLEGVVVDTISTATGEFVTRTWRTTLDANGSLDVLLKDLGGTDANAVINALVVRDPTIVKVDFGTAGSPVAPSYARATHATTYSDTLRFGWVSGTIGSRDRGTSDPLTRDFCLSGDATFRLGRLPGENYEVLLTSGDAGYAHDQMHLRVGGAHEWRSTAVNEFVDVIYRVGAGSNEFDLDVGIKDDGGTDTNAVLNAIDSEPMQSIDLDFGTASSPLDAGYRRVTAADRYRPANGLGWLSGTVVARDRAKGDARERDLVATAKATFVIDVPRGSYWVGVGLGDPSFAHDQMKITVEGQTLGTYSTSAMEFVQAETSSWANVTDGQLTIELEDLGGADPFVAMVYLLVQ